MKTVVVTFNENPGLNNEALAQIVGKAVASVAKPIRGNSINIWISDDDREAEIAKSMVYAIPRKTNLLQKEAVKHAVVYISTLAKDELESLNMIRIAVALSKLYRKDEKAKLAIEVILTNKELLRTVGVKLHHLNHPKVLELLQDIVNFYKDV